jgi:glycosyltransferase involved in cell wall biosynthesis
MAAGLAVIASDHPAYREVIASHENGYLGRMPGDFNAAFEQLRDPILRQAVSRQGYETVVRDYSIKALTEKLLGTLQAQ